MSFSRRMWLIKVDDVIQIDSMNSDLRNSLRNFYYDWFSELNVYQKEKFLYERIWKLFYKLPIDNLRRRECFDDLKSDILKWFEWYRVYDFLEFIMLIDEGYYIAHWNIETLNIILERENSGYRVIGNRFVPIVDSQEINSVESVLNSSCNNIENVQFHISESLRYLSKKPSPDFRLSIKESISAVEALCRMIIWDENATLWPALSKIKQRIEIDESLTKAYNAIYWWTSNEGWIRHAIKDRESELYHEDALYMLVSCSAFVNYLIAKAKKAWIII